MNLADAQRLLNENGFPAGPIDGIYGPRTKAGLIRFQEAHAFTFLDVNGHFDVPTRNALALLPKLSPHFTTGECRSHEAGGNCFISRLILRALETMRADRGGRPIPLVSAYRSPERNRRIGGARYSLHTYGPKLVWGYRVGGFAVDIPRSLNIHRDYAIGTGLFGGIGYLDRSRRVVHVDTRHLIGRGKVNGSMWTYPE